MRFYCTVPTCSSETDREKKKNQNQVFLQLTFKISMKVINISIQYVTDTITNQCYKRQHSQVSSLLEGHNTNLGFDKDTHLS